MERLKLHDNLMGHGWGQVTNNLINLDLIDIIQFCLRFMVETPQMVGGWVCQWVNGWVR